MYLGGGVGVPGRRGGCTWEKRWVYLGGGCMGGAVSVSGRGVCVSVKEVGLEYMRRGGQSTTGVGCRGVER